MILMLNCSYKAKNGNTLHFLEVLKSKFAGKDANILNLRPILNGGFAEFEKLLEQAEAFVIGAPLYVDGLPSQCVKLLEMLLEKNDGRFAGKTVYVVSNLGFYEGEQIAHLFDMVKNWCARMQMTYGGGIAVGAGALVKALNGMPILKLLNGDIQKGMKKMADKILMGEAMENYYAKTKVPRMIYLQAAHMLFRKELKKNGN